MIKALPVLLVVGTAMLLADAEQSFTETDIALQSAGASCEASTSDDPWARGTDCGKVIQGTDSWGAATGIHLKYTGSGDWVKITFADSGYAVHSVTVKQCDSHVSQHFKIETFDAAGQYTLIHTYSDSVAQTQTYDLPTPQVADGIRITLTGRHLTCMLTCALSLSA